MNLQSAVCKLQASLRKLDRTLSRVKLSKTPRSEIARKAWKTRRLRKAMKESWARRKGKTTDGRTIPWTRGRRSQHSKTMKKLWACRKSQSYSKIADLSSKKKWVSKSQVDPMFSETIRKTWTPERRRQHSKAMKRYWKQLKQDI